MFDKDNRIVDTELKLNNPNKARAHKLFFASELQKIDKPPKKIISQDTTENWNQMEIDYQEARESTTTGRRESPSDEKPIKKRFAD